MPCTMTGSVEGDRALAYQELSQKHGDTITELTQILCEVVQVFKDCGLKMPPKLQKFAEHHDKVDKRRKAKEKAEKIRKAKIAKAKAKLSLEEKQLLKIDEEEW